jgi:uncharacterized protein (TIGR02266 family)
LTQGGSKTDRRRFRRVPISTRIEAQVGGESHSVTAENVSPGGMLIRSSKTLPEGTKVKLIFTLPGTKQEFRLSGTVLHVSPDAYMGVRFDDLTPEQVQALTLFVESKETTL